MMGSPDDFRDGLDAARNALGRGDRIEAERTLREVIAFAEYGSADESALPTALIELAALRRDVNDVRDAEALLERARTVLESMAAPDDAMLVAALTGLAGIASTRNDVPRTQQLLARALHVADRSMAGDHPDVVRLLGDLSRLSLKHGAYAVAEPLLVRLHDVKRRSKGDDHPEAATVLASLATVRQALGRHDEAESMWRRVLEVRERTLAPNHFATASALQNLAESCAARGKLGEALQMLQRATTMREITMGSNHPSVRVARDRIADLELQSSEDAPDLVIDPPPARTPPPVRTEIGANEPLPVPRADVGESQPYQMPRADVGESQPFPMPRANVSESQPYITPREDAGESQAYLTLLALQEQSPARLAPSPMLPALEAIIAEHELEEAERAESLSERARGVLSSTAATINRQRLPVAVASGVAVMLLLGLASTRSRASSDVGAPDVAVASGPSTPAPIVAPPAAPMMSAGMLLATEEAGAASSTSVAPRAAAVGARHEERKAPRSSAAETARENVREIATPIFSRQAFSRIDSFARSVKAPSVALDEAFPVKLAADLPTTSFGTVSAPDANDDIVRAQLISRPTQPRFPESLRGRKIEGDVSVRFTVDTMGRPDLSTFSVVRTPHDLMSDAVRLVVPSMRFVPARSAGGSGRAQRDEVEVSFQFRLGAKK